MLRFSHHIMFFSSVFLSAFLSGCSTSQTNNQSSADQMHNSNNRFMEVDANKGDWTLVVVPDTQHYTENRPSAPFKYMEEAFDWIVKNRSTLNIQYVQGLGDITENWDSELEWSRAASAWYKLRGIVPHMPVAGNHDSIEMLNKKFPREYYSSMTWYKGDTGGIENSYSILKIGSTNYLFLQIQSHDQYSEPPQSAAEWANNIIAQHQDKPVILATHDTWATNKIRDKILIANDNIMLSNAGHDCVREALYTVSGPKGGISHNFVADYQCDQMETMLLRLYIFKPQLNKVYYYTYSPITNKFESDASSEGNFPLPKQKSD